MYLAKAQSEPGWEMRTLTAAFALVIAQKNCRPGGCEHGLLKATGDLECRTMFVVVIAYKNWYTPPHRMARPAQNTLLLHVRVARSVCGCIGAQGACGVLWHAARVCEFCRLAEGLPAGRGENRTHRAVHRLEALSLFLARTSCAECSHPTPTGRL